jgi:CheY-like chemotaxis protein
MNPIELAPSLLVVEDEAIILNLLLGVLSGEHYRVVCASNGREAVDLYRTRHVEIDLVVLDFHMPGMNGTDTLALLREINPDVRCLLMSGSPDAIFCEQGGLRNVVGIISKPFGVRPFLELVRTVLPVTSVP